jgi:hypothetical protein
MKNPLLWKSSEKMMYDQPQAAAKKVQDTILEKHIFNLIQMMPQHCEVVIQANGLFTKY